MASVTFGALRLVDGDAFGDREVDAYLDGRMIGTLYRYPSEGMEAWAGDAGIEAKFGDNFADGDRHLGTTKARLRREAEKWG